MEFLDKEVELILKDCIDQASDFPAVLAKKFEGLSFAEEEQLRSHISVLINRGFLSKLQWADNVPYHGRIEQKGFSYFKNKEIYIRGKLRQDLYFSLLDEDSEKQLSILIESEDPAPIVSGTVVQRRIIENLSNCGYVTLGSQGFSDFFDGSFSVIVRVTQKGKNYFSEKEQRVEEILLLSESTVASEKPNNGVSEKPNDKMNKKVFIVHGHDDAAKQETARMLEKIGYESVILHEQADSGKTIIEKIETYTNVAFAVVLYTECDLGRAKEESESQERYRARQNVVFEHGYLIAKLGRERVCALVKGKVETPGDISGVVYTPMNTDGGWKLKLAQNMRAVGLAVDVNQLI